MRDFFLVAGIFTVALFACLKPRNENKLVDLTIISTTTPSTQIAGQEIISAASCRGANLCYKFSKFEIKEITQRQFEIRAKATFPKGKNIVCAEAVYNVDAESRIRTTTAGEYLLQFYNQQVLLKTDTVQVN
jgi:hypothetical protein